MPPNYASVEVLSSFGFFWEFFVLFEDFGIFGDFIPINKDD
jgi:hypothetical protein